MTEPSPDPGRARYLRVERLHLRQWALRAVPPLAVLATNGAAWVDLPALPRHDAPLRALGLPPAAGTAAQVAGAGMVVLAVVLRVRAKGVLVRRSTVTTAGVYGRVRHPFYLGNLLGGAGVLLLAGALGAVAAATWLALALPVFLVTVAGEEAGLRAAHGAAWDDYAARVPRLVPRTLRGDGGGRVTWAGLVAEGEPPRCLRFLAGALVVVAARSGGTAGTAVAVLAATLFAASHAVGRASRRAA